MNPTQGPASDFCGLVPVEAESSALSGALDGLPRPTASFSGGGINGQGSHDKSYRNRLATDPYLFESAGNAR